MSSKYLAKTRYFVLRPGPEAGAIFDKKCLWSAEKLLE